MSFSPRATANSASAVSLFNLVDVRGYNTYTLGTNIISWDESNNYTLDYVARDFGQPLVVNDVANTLFKCGDSAINAFDFGLLFSCFAAIVGAYAETGSSVMTERQESSVDDIDIVWFGDNAIVISKIKNIIVPVKSSIVQEVCSLSRIKVDNFVDTRSFYLSRENNNFIVDAEDGTEICRFPIPLIVKRTFPNLFSDSGFSKYAVEDDPNTPWDERSALGSLIANTTNLMSVEEAIARYRSEQVSLESVVVRSDLMFVPSTRYNSVEEFLSSVCYTDKGIIALAVNFRNNLFVYKPWFASDSDAELRVDANPKFDEFYNVTSESQHISRFAQSVVARPLTPAEFDVSVFERVKDSFYNFELSRIKLESAFGKIVIPESVLVQGLTGSSGEAMYCIVPVGLVGEVLVCLTSDGGLTTMTQLDWLSESFYDITEVIRL